jgi:hypothetical protein
MARSKALKHIGYPAYYVTANVAEQSADFMPTNIIRNAELGCAISHDTNDKAIAMRLLWNANGC